MIRSVLVLAALGALAGCSRATLPYTPEAQPPGATVSAAYMLLSDRLRVEIDTDGHRLEEVKIIRPDGSVAYPQTIEHAPTAVYGGSSVSFGFGGGSFGGGTATGMGVGVTTPVGSPATRVEGPSAAYFALDQVGPAPWRVHVKLIGIAPALIVMGPMPPPPAAK
ncbi:MAG TPA: hypothetical protein VLG10_05250 [Methylomirabilota bacterium]|nr:hypothetical protein [Methylomirabilota bacterium]